MTSYMGTNEPGPPTPRRRVWRTVAQVTIATLVAVPSAVAVLPIDAALAASVVGIAGAVVILATAAMNAYDSHTGRG